MIVNGFFVIGVLSNDATAQVIGSIIYNDAQPFASGPINTVDKSEQRRAGLEPFTIYTKFLKLVVQVMLVRFSASNLSEYT